jgi:hypothetical protein
MCDPTSIAVAGLALSGVSTVTSMIAQQQQASAAASAQNEYNRQQEENALIARNQNLAALEAERNSALGDTREQINQNQMALRRAQATARVSAGEAGVAGLSVDALLRDLAGQAGYDNATATENYLRRDADINARRENVQIGATNAVTSIRNPQIQSPDYLGSALRIGQAGLNNYAYYQDRQDRLKNPQTK